MHIESAEGHVEKFRIIDRQNEGAKRNRAEKTYRILRAKVY